MAIASAHPWTNRVRARAAVIDARDAWIGFGALMLVALAYLMYKSRGNTFFYDEWGFIQQRHSGLHSIVAADNQHMLILQLALEQLLFKLVGLSHYWVYKLCEILAHLSCAALLFEFARRRIGAVAVIVIAPFLVLGTGWQYVLWGANVGFVLSFTFSIGALLALERGDRRGDAIACALLVLGILSSEFTLVFAAGIAVELWLRRKRSFARAWVWLVPVALYAVWWLGYHEASHFRQNLTSAPGFAAELAAAAVGGLLGLTLDWGRSLLVGAGAGLAFLLYRRGSITPRLAGLLVAAGAFWLLVALGRANLGEPDASRYVYSGVVLILLVGSELFTGSVPRPSMVAGLALLALFSLAGNIKALTGGENFLRQQSHQMSAELGALQLARKYVSPTYAVDPHLAPQIFAGGYFAAIDAIGSSPAAPPRSILQLPEFARTAADATLVNAGELALAPNPSASLGAAAPQIERTLIGTASVVNHACLRFASGGNGATLDVLLPAQGVRISAAAGPAVPVRARRFAADYEGAPVATVGAGKAIKLRARGDRSNLPWHLRISPHQSAQICTLPG